MRRKKSSPSRPAGGRVRKYLLPKPEEFRAIGRAVSQVRDVPIEDLVMSSVLIDQLETALERASKGGAEARFALLDWAAGAAQFQRKVGVRRFKRILALIREVYGGQSSSRG